MVSVHFLLPALNIMSILILCTLLTFVIFFFHFRYQKSTKLIKPITISMVLSAVCVLSWFYLMAPNDSDSKVVKLAVPLTIDEILLEIQDKLREDKNNPDLWFQLGQGYFANGEFENANTCFEYVLRLTDEPSSTVYAAKATALYYVSSQRITEEVSRLLDISLSKDKLNDTALMLIANDHFISFKYEEAIEVWQKVLDSERQGIDRVAIINSINRAQELKN